MRSWFINSILITALFCGTAFLSTQFPQESATETFQHQLLGTWEFKLIDGVSYLERVPVLTEDQGGFWFLPNGKLYLRSPNSASPHGGGHALTSCLYEVNAPNSFSYQTAPHLNPDCRELVLLHPLGPDKMEISFSKFSCKSDLALELMANPDHYEPIQ